ncbi:MAG: hypothetical protein JSW27_18455, partial [Phycisphaerales bacterium]
MEASRWRSISLGFLLFVGAVRADEPLARTGRYVLDPNTSAIVQTGGIAGVHWTYAVEGQFCLIVDTEAGSARFEQVDANAIDDSEPARTLDPNEAFNLAGLTGTFRHNGSIVFRGQTADGSSALLTLTVADDTLYLAGQTVPPPN